MGSMSSLPEITIDDAMVRFLGAQRPRLAPRTFRRYEEICELLRHCLNGYGYTGLSELERKRWERAYEAGDEDAFCHLMGPEQLVDNLGEFLGYYAGGTMQTPTIEVRAIHRRRDPILLSARSPDAPATVSISLIASHFPARCGSDRARGCGTP